MEVRLMRIGTCIEDGNGPQYVDPGLEAIKFAHNEQEGVFLRLRMKCSACDHLQQHDSRGYLLGEVRGLQGAAKDILDEILDARAGRVDCDFCGQLSLLVPKTQLDHVKQWLSTNITPEWFAIAELSPEHPAKII